jgi:hypothetical protein
MSWVTWSQIASLILITILLISAGVSSAIKEWKKP